MTKYTHNLIKNKCDEVKQKVLEVLTEQDAITTHGRELLRQAFGHADHILIVLAQEPGVTANQPAIDVPQTKAILRKEKVLAAMTEMERMAERVVEGLPPRKPDGMQRVHDDWAAHLGRLGFWDASFGRYTWVDGESYLQARERAKAAVPDKPDGLGTEYRECDHCDGRGCMGSESKDICEQCGGSGKVLESEFVPWKPGNDD